MTRELLPAGRRELTQAHIRFYRSVMDGVDLDRAWSLYLGVDGDYSQTLAVATMGWVRQALIQEALAAGQAGLIGLFRREPWRVKSNAKPTLAEFASRFEDAGDWSESELTEMWKAEYGGNDRSEARRERLSKRLREALQLLERASRRQPKPEDPVATWLAPNLAARLSEAGLATLGAVRQALNERTTARWEAVPGVGGVWADRLTTWFDEHSVQAPAKPSTAVRQLVPLELLDVAQSPALRPSLAVGPVATRGSLEARNDKHAIELWLAARATNPNTLRSYRKNAERLLLWCMYERRIGLQDFTVQDCIHYRTWLMDLGRKSPAEWSEAGWNIPAQQWMATKHSVKRDSPDWRPFDGPLSPGSVAQDLLVVKALFTFLLRGGYVSHQPWDLLGRSPRTAGKLEDASEQFVSRSLEQDQWRFILEGVDPSLGDRPARLHLVLWLGYACGLRAAEMLSLTLSSLQPRSNGWRLRVLGKGGKVRTIPLPSPARDACLRYLESVGLDLETVTRLAQEGSTAPVLRSQPGRRFEGRKAPSTPLKYTTLYGDLKAHFVRRAADLAGRDPTAVGKFKAASTHWLRHTCATQAARAGVPLKAVQQVLGHSNLTTTSGYLTQEQEALQAEMERFTTKST